MTSFQKPFWLFVLGNALLGASCGGTSPSSSTDAHQSDGGPGGTFGCPIPSNEGGCIPVAVESRSAPANYSCRGSRQAPPYGDPRPLTLRLEVFGMAGQVARNTKIWFFPDNTIRDRCEAPNCQEVTTNEMGEAPVQVRGQGWYAYRVFQNLMGQTLAT
ncbi:MAG: hypothetical protein NZM37_05075, partial [Sandaracinaceae bacterium]|nr:hypothetical protein [Sandaracinaceae bacterium]